jgi:hypothetical protein
VEYLELIKVREKVISKLKKDYPKLIVAAKKWTAENGFDPAKILWIEAHVAYPSGSCQEKIYVDDKKGHAPMNRSDKFLGKRVIVGGTDYHIEILISTT